jgi:hypothetical protein
MNIARQIDYGTAVSFFSDAEKRGKKLLLGNMLTRFWLHKERINHEFVLESARRFSDAKVFIVSEGNFKGFYIYSESRRVCLQLINNSAKFAQAVPA